MEGKERGLKGRQEGKRGDRGGREKENKEQQGSRGRMERDRKGGHGREEKAEEERWCGMSKVLRPNTVKSTRTDVQVP